MCRTCVAGKDKDGKVVRQGGGFNPEHGILVCANYMRSKGHLEDTVAHEMVHAWDHLRWKVDWGDLRHAACSEVSFGFSFLLFGVLMVLEVGENGIDGNVVKMRANGIIDSSECIEWRV